MFHPRNCISVVIFVAVYMHNIIWSHGVVANTLIRSFYVHLTHAEVLSDIRTRAILAAANGDSYLWRVHLNWSRQEMCGNHIPVRNICMATTYCVYRERVICKFSK